MMRLLQAGGLHVQHLKLTKVTKRRAIGTIQKSLPRVTDAMTGRGNAGGITMKPKIEGIVYGCLAVQRRSAAAMLLALAKRLGPICLAALFWFSQEHAVAQEAADQVLKGPDGDAAAEPGEGLLPVNSSWVGDFDGMRKRRQIRMLVPFSKTYYFIDKGGEQFGMTYELGRAFEDQVNKKYKTKSLRINVIFIPVSRDRLLSRLADGVGDIAAGNLTVTPERLKLVDFSDPLAVNVREVIVTGPRAPPLASVEDLAGKEIMVRPSSSYFEHLRSLSASFEAAGHPALVLTPLDEDLEDEDILEMVNAGLLPWAVVDEHKAKPWAGVFTDIVIRSDLAVNEGGEIAWAMRKDSPLLRQEIDEFVAGHKIGTRFGNMLKSKYLGSSEYAKRATSDDDMKKFEALIEIFRKYGEQYDFDALMIAAQGYQESGLDQSA